MFNMSDRTLTCRDCNQPFTFTAGEQEFYQQRGYTEPQRCSSCRAERKAQRDSSSGYSSSSYSGSSYGQSSSGYSSGPRTMHPATCSACGKQTEVPFEPSGNKPVYCRECYQSRRPATSNYGRY
jgi:CxxC-x17-CxxC domain-containing protein